MYKEEVKSEQKKNKYISMICGGEFTGYGHSSILISDKGVCCDSCNTKFIIDRIKRLVNK